MPYKIGDAEKKPVSQKQAEHLAKARQLAVKKKRENKEVLTKLKQIGGGKIPDISALTESVNTKMKQAEDESFDIDTSNDLSIDHIDKAIENRIPKLQEKRAEKIIAKGAEEIKEKRAQSKPIPIPGSSANGELRDKNGRRVVYI
jgi:hypothetical protein